MAKDKKKKKGEEEEVKDDAEEKPAKGKGEAPEGEEGEEGAAAEGAEAAPKKSKKKIIIIGVVALVVLIAAGAGAYFMGFLHHGESADAGAGEGGKGAASAIYYTMPEFLVNLNTGGKQASYLKTTVILQLSHQIDIPIVEANLPKLFDTMNTYLRELRASDLSGSAGIQRLREELLFRANQALAPTKVDDILFKEIVVQ